MATSKSQILVGSTISAEKWNGEAGADVAFSIEGITSTSGRVSAQKDLGASPRDGWYYWHGEILMQATPTQYTSLKLFAASAPDGDSTMITGDVGATDAALGDVDQLRNLQPIGDIVIEEADTTKMVGSGVFFFPHRYLSLVLHNDATGATTNATDSNCIILVNSYNWQGQAT